MINPEYIDLVERFQTTIVGIVGFGGVILTMYFNARSVAAEHRRQLKTKRNTLRRILSAEFRSYSSALRGNVQPAAPDKELFTIGRIRRLYSNSMAADLGLLEPLEIDYVIHALISMDGWDHFMENLSKEHSDTRFVVAAENWVEFCEGAATTADALDGAVEKIEEFSENHRPTLADKR